MIDRPVLIDLYCKAGGAGRGYQEAGFHVIGVDKDPQPRYAGDEFIQADALEFLRDFIASGKAVAAIHASPPCQASSRMRTRHPDREYPELIPGTRALLLETGLPYIIENVKGAKLVNPTLLCGSSFGLEVQRHRLFETSFPIAAPKCAHKLQDHVVPVYGHSGAGANRGRERARGRANGVAEWREAMEIDWMTGTELSQAIPPAYTRYIGYFLRALVEKPVAAQLSSEQAEEGR